MSTVNKSMLGIGIYSPREAARYVRATPDRFRRWIYGTTKSAPVFDPDIPREGARELITFLDFAQALQVQDIRLNVGVPLQKIRQAYETARTKHGITHPFAVRNRILVFGNLNEPAKCSLVLCDEEEADDEDFRAENAKKYIQLTGKKKGNVLISEVVQKFSANLIYSPKGMAGGYVAHSGFGHRILIDPEIRFGKPHIEGLIYEAESLADAARNEGSVDRVADLYEVSPAAVQAAVDYIKALEKEPPKITPKPIENFAA